MAWFRNHYRCDVCKCTWTDEWCSMSDDDCPCCSARNMTPYASDDLTEVTEKLGRVQVMDNEGDPGSPRS